MFHPFCVCVSILTTKELAEPPARSWPCTLGQDPSSPSPPAPLSPSHRGRPPGDVEGNFYLLSRPLMTQRRNCLLFFSFLFFLVCSPQYLFVRARQGKKKKRTKRFAETKAKVMKNEREDNSAWGVQTNYLEQIVYFKVLTNLLQRPVEKSQVPYSNPFPYL